MGVMSLLKTIKESFNRDELKTLCFSLDLDFEDLGSNTLEGQIRDLIALCKRHGIMEQLLARLETLRPRIAWQELWQSDSLSQQVPPVNRASGAGLSSPLVANIVALQQDAARLMDLLQQGVKQYAAPGGLFIERTIEDSAIFNLERDLELNAFVAWAQSYGLFDVLLPTSGLDELFIELNRNLSSTDKSIDGYKIAQLLLALGSAPEAPRAQIEAVWSILENQYLKLEPNGTGRYLIGLPGQPNKLSWAGTFLILALTTPMARAYIPNALLVAEEIAQSIFTHLEQGDGIRRGKMFDATDTRDSQALKAFGNSLYGVGLIALFRFTGKWDYVRRGDASITTICRLVSEGLWDDVKDLPLQSDISDMRKVRALAATLLFLSEYLADRIDFEETSLDDLDAQTKLAWRRMTRLLAVLLDLATRGQGLLPCEVYSNLRVALPPDGLTQAYGLLAATATVRLLSPAQR